MSQKMVGSVILALVIYVMTVGTASAFSPARELNCPDDTIEVCSDGGECYCIPIYY